MSPSQTEFVFNVNIKIRVNRNAAIASRNYISAKKSDKWMHVDKQDDYMGSFICNLFYCFLQLFDTLRKENSQGFTKLIAVQGDVTELNLGKHTRTFSVSFND